MHANSTTAAIETSTLIVGGTGPEVAGSLFAIERPGADAPDIELLDRLNSSGIAVLDDRLYRVLASPSEAGASGDLLAYDSTGVVSYRRVDGLADSHGLLWDGTHFVVPCSATNQIFRLARDGATAGVWKAPGDGDAWHVNGVHARAGRLYASAFGKFPEHRGWSKNVGQRTGIIFDVETLEPVVADLACPHDPTFTDGGWIVCDSYTKRLLMVDEATGRITRDLQLSGWTRGLALSERHIFVGLSGQRHKPTGRQHAAIAVVDRRTWQLVREIDLECEEITCLALVPRTFVSGLRRGFRTNDLRSSVQDRRDLFELAGNVPRMYDITPMAVLEEPKDRRIRIRVSVPRSVPPGEYFTAQISLKNLGRKTLFSGAPFPINFGIMFTPRAKGPGPIEERRARLPEPLPPGATLRFHLPVKSPERYGEFDVKFTLVQEWVRWFDAERSRNACTVQLRVVQPAAKSINRRPLGADRVLVSTGS